MPGLDAILKAHAPRISEEYIPLDSEYTFVTGAAGTGKTWLQKRAIEQDPKYGVLCATTGIAAINLGATTLNSVLNFFDTESLRDRLVKGALARKLHAIGKKVRKVVIDEISMMDGRQLDYIHKGVQDANDYSDMRDRPLGIVLTGDFCQLPPIKAPYAFEADCWEHFERNTTTLTQPWRQDNLEFLNALNAARAGRGQECVDILKSLGVRFTANASGRFQGTTILSKNDAVDNFNYAALMDVQGEAYGLKRATWLYPGQAEPGEWKNIPDVLRLKDGAYVMILANDISGSFEYANGDCGHIQGHDEKGTVWVKLIRNEALVGIKPITRYKTMALEDAEKLGLDPYAENEGLNLRTTHLYCEDECDWDQPGLRFGPWGVPSYNCSQGNWNVGGVKFYPLRLAYATTCHKSQGLTLDRCQIDTRDAFFGSPGLAYVALSRCKKPEGLVIVGTPDQLAGRIKIDPKVRRWI